MPDLELDAGLESGGDAGADLPGDVPAGESPAEPIVHDPDPRTPRHEKISNGAAVVFVVLLVVLAGLSLYAAVRVWQSRAVA